ncbi:uncharacterized protein EV420DRAFT_1555596, partial [Desarmillaria tabescens]
MAFLLTVLVYTHIAPIHGISCPQLTFIFYSASIISLSPASIVLPVFTFYVTIISPQFSSV